MLRSPLLYAALALITTGCSALQPGMPGRLAVAPLGPGKAVAPGAQAPAPISTEGGSPGAAPAAPALPGATSAGGSGGVGPIRYEPPTGLNSLVTNFSLVDNPRLAKSRESLEALDAVLVEAGLVSNNGGGFISNNGGSLLGNNGGNYRVAGVTTVDDISIVWDDVTGEIREVVGAWGRLAFSVLGGDGIREFRADLTEGPHGTTGAASLAVAGLWEVRPDFWETLIGESTDEPVVLGDGAVPTTLAGLQAAVSIVPRGDATLTMAFGLELDYGDRPGGIENLLQLPSRYSLSLQLPGLRFDWAGAPADVDATETAQLAHAGVGALTVETQSGPDRLDIAFESRVASGAAQPEIALLLRHERSGFALDPARRAGAGALAGLSSLGDDEGAGMLLVGELNGAPLRVIKGNGATLDWQLFPAAWRETLPDVEVPAGLFPVASPAVQP